MLERAKAGQPVPQRRVPIRANNAVITGKGLDDDSTNASEGVEKSFSSIATHQVDQQASVVNGQPAPAQWSSITAIPSDRAHISRTGLKQERPAVRRALSKGLRVLFIHTD